MKTKHRKLQCCYFPIRAVLAVLLMMVFSGCTSKPAWDGSRQADRKERLTRGCVFYFDGAGGGTMKSNYAGGVVEGMLAAGYPGGGELMAWETDQGLMADQKASVEYKRAKAAESADAIRLYQKNHPGAPRRHATPGH